MHREPGAHDAVVWYTEWVGGLLCGGCAYTHTRKCIYHTVHLSLLSTAHPLVYYVMHPTTFPTGARQECVIGLEHHNLLATFGEDSHLKLGKP